MLKIYIKQTVFIVYILILNERNFLKEKKTKIIKFFNENTII